MAGVFLKDINSLMVFSKIGGILLFAPAFFYMFPGIPQWVGYFFPTYYILEPIVELTQRGGAWPDISLYVFVLIGLIALFSIILSVVLRQKAEQQLAF